MNVLPAFDLVRPRSLEELLAARARYPRSRLLGGGTDLTVNLRRGIGEPPDALIETNEVAELQVLDTDGERLRIGAGVRIARLARDPGLARLAPVLAQAAASIAGPTHREMGTVGGNLCLDTRCIWYNQSEWWRAANGYCLKHRGSMCHVAPRSRVCFATFSADLPPALLVLGAEVEIAGPGGRRTAPLDALYTGDGERYLALEPGEVVVAVELPRPRGLACAYDKVRVRQSIDYPLAGVAVALRREGDALAELRVAFTGTNPRPLRLEGTEGLCTGPLDQGALDRLEGLVRRQVMAMRTTFTQGHYRRHAAGVLARRLAGRLWAEAGPGEA